MASMIIVVENTKDWRNNFPDYKVVSAKDYLSHAEYFRSRGLRVVNLCRTYKYLSTGYYCSLLGEARRHRVIPSIQTITDLSSKAIYSLNVEDLDLKIQKTLNRHHIANSETRFESMLFFGQTEDRELQEISRQIFDLFPAPILRIEFRRHQNWQIASIKTISIHSLNADQEMHFTHGLNQHLQKKSRNKKSRSSARYDLAILHNPDEQLPPSNNAAFKKFIDAGKKIGTHVELITRKDYNRLAEFDALFIRETTAINHYTYRFAKKAQAEGMVVIDDPDSIVKCCNKVYLTELLRLHRIPAPRTVILRKGDSLSELENITGLPVVLKIPDGSFSRGIYKAKTIDEIKPITEKLFQESDLILAQEFLYTDYDWRIGILNNQILFACQYFMSPKHWQIVRHDDKGGAKEGGFRAIPLGEVPDKIIDVAKNAAKLIGNGFYGVDLKERDGNIYVIEVNDNPNIDKGVEDVVIGDSLYQIILSEIVRRIEVSRGIN